MPEMTVWEILEFNVLDRKCPTNMMVCTSSIFLKMIAFGLDFSGNAQDLFRNLNVEKLQGTANFGSKSKKSQQGIALQLPLVNHTKC